MPPTDLAISCTASSPTPRPEISVTASAVENPGQEQKFQQLGFGKTGGHLGRRQSLGDHDRSQRFDVHSAAVVRHRQHEKAGAMARFQTNRAGRRLAGGDALFGPLDAVVQAVANRVVERRFEAIEDFTVHFRVRSNDLELRLLAKLARKVANQSRKTLDAVAERPHPTRHDLAVEAIGKSCGAKSEAIQLAPGVRQPTAAFLAPSVVPPPALPAASGELSYERL